MAVYYIAIAIAALFSVPTHARVVVHPKAVPNSYQNTKTYNAQKIKKKQFVNQVIQNHSSAYVKQTGFHGQLSTVSFRGLSAAHTLVLLDGIPLNGSSDGLFDFSILQSKSIDSVKITPGSSSVLHGPYATGGVLELTSHQAVKNQKTLQAEGGSFHTLNGYAGLDRVYDCGNYTVYTEGYRTDGLPKQEDTRILGERNKASNGGGGAYLNHHFRKTDLSVFFKGTASNLKYDANTSNIPPKPQDKQYRSITLMGTKLTGDSHNYQGHHELLMARFNDYRNYGGNSFTDPTRHYGTYNFTYYGLKNGESHFVFTGDHESLKQANLFKKERVTIGTAASHNHLILQNLFIDLGVRNDHLKRYKNHQTYSSGIRYRLNRATFFISYRTGFRPPTLNNLYQENGFVEANRNLNPEKSGSTEMGVKLNLTNYKLQLSYYQSLVKNMLVTTQQDNKKYKTYNVQGNTRIDGIDVQQSLIIDDTLDLSLGYSFINFDRLEPGVASEIPRHKINGSINWKISEKWESEISGQWVGNRKSGSTLLRNYTVVNFNLTHHLNASSFVYLKINNLFDERYTAVKGYRSPRQEVYVGTILTF